MPDDGDDLDNAIDDGSRTGQPAAQAQASAPLSGQPEFDFDDIAMPAAAVVPAVVVAVAATEPAPPTTVQPEPMAPEDPDNFVVESVEVVHEEHTESPAIVVTVSSVIEAETETEEAPAPAPVFSSAGLFDQVAVHADADTESSTDTDAGIAESQPDPTPTAVPTWVTEEREQASPDRQA